jgi:hypothetical protein
VTKDNDKYVAKLRRQLEHEAKVGEELKKLGLLPDGSAFKQPNGSAFRDQRWNQEFWPAPEPDSAPAPKPTPAAEWCGSQLGAKLIELIREHPFPIRQAIVRDIVRRQYPPGGKLPLELSVAWLKRAVIDKMWEAACKSAKWEAACKRHGVSPKKSPDANTVARAIGRRVA